MSEIYKNTLIQNAQRQMHCVNKFSHFVKISSSLKSKFTKFQNGLDITAYILCETWLKCMCCFQSAGEYLQHSKHRSLLLSQFARIKFHWNYCIYCTTQWEKLIHISGCYNKNPCKNRFCDSHWKGDPISKIVHGVTSKILIQCKICYTSGTNAFHLLYTVVNKTWVASIFFECVFGGHFEFQNGCHIYPFSSCICPKTKHSHIFVMIIITYVSQNPLETSFNSFSRIQDGRQIQNGRHFSLKWYTVMYIYHLSFS